MAEETPQYILQDQGQDIDEAVNRMLNPDSHPTDGSTRYVTSAGLKDEFDRRDTEMAAIAMKVGRDVDISESEYQRLVNDGLVDPNKNYYIFEDR